MPLELYASASFSRSIRKLGAEQHEVAAQILETLKVYYASGCNLQEAQRKSPQSFRQVLQEYF